MSDLGGVLDFYENAPEGALPPSTKRVLAAARRWAEFPTDEDVEAAAQAVLASLQYEYPTLRFAPYGMESVKVIARAALGAVRARETGETET